MNRYRIFSLLILLSLLSFCALWPGKTSELKELLRRMQDETGALSPAENPAFGKNNHMNK